MNEKKKGFNLFPEYVWMIFVGMLLALLILTNVIPGHAGEVSPVAGSDSVAFSYESPDHPEYVYTSPFRTGVTLDSQGFYNWPDPPQKVYASDDYGVNYTSVINATRFSNDVKLIKGSVGFNFAGTSLIHVSKANYTGYFPGTVQESWYEDFQVAGYTYFGCDLWVFPFDNSSAEPICIGYLVIKFSGNEIPTLSKVNRIYNRDIFQVDFDPSKVVETLTYFNENADYVWGPEFDRVGWGLSTQLIYEGLVDHSGDTYHRVYVKTVNRGDFYFDHVSYNEQYTSNYKYRANIECLDLHRESDPDEPEPELQSFDILVYYDPWFSSEGSIRWQEGYYLFSFNAALTSSVEVPSSLTYSTALDSGFSNPWVNNAVLLFRSNLNEFCLYFSGSLISTEYRFLGSTSPSGSIDSIKNNFNPVSYSYSSDSFNLRTSSYGGLTCVSILSDVSMSSFKSNFVYNLGSYPDFQVTSSNFFNTNSSSHDNALYLAYCLGLSGSPSPSNPDLSPSPVPTSTPEPLPTSGESIHVILPTGTPTPTPPFTVSGGSDGSGGSGGGSGSGSPGSIGSGLSSVQTSGVLQAWTLYVSDNPAMVFLTSTFQALPQELLYPLYILLFILLLLAVIRLFVHFSGG